MGCLIGKPADRREGIARRRVVGNDGEGDVRQQRGSVDVHKGERGSSGGRVTGEEKGAVIIVVVVWVRVEAKQCRSGQ